MIKLKPLILESDWAQDQIAAQKEVDLSKEEFEVSERGFNHVKEEIDKLNKKATKYGVPPIELKTIKEFYKKVFINGDGHIIRKSENLQDVENFGETSKIVKYFILKLDGKPPVVEGFEFIAKVEHTEVGNILNFNPHASIKNLPIEYRTASQKCDVCQTNRDRNNTFILKLEKEDLQRFPDKKIGDYIMAGSACLKRFLPPKDLSILVAYAQILENIRDIMSKDNDGDSDGGGDGGANSYIQTKVLAHILSIVYTYFGKYISKKKSVEVSETGGSLSSTSDWSRDFMNRNYKKHWQKEVEEMDSKSQDDSAFISKVDVLEKEFAEWKDKKNFTEEEQKNPNYADFFHNMSVMAKSEMVGDGKLNMYSALFGMFLRDRGEFEKKSSVAKTPKSYVGKIGEKITTDVTIKNIKEFNGQWGPQSLYTMETVDGNSLVWWTGAGGELNQGDTVKIIGTVKSQEPNKYTGIPQTTLTRVKVIPTGT